MSLRAYQERAIGELRKAYASDKRAPVLVLPTGAGKCLGLGTLVLRYDGISAPVETIMPGDLLMGPDSKPRRVLSTTSGVGELYRVVPVKGEPWVCNDVHILTLVNIESDVIVDVELPTYLTSTKWFRHTHKQFTPERGVDFAAAETLPLDPYFLGVWYGDGTKSLVGVGISKPDPEILDACKTVAARFGSPDSHRLWFEPDAPRIIFMADAGEARRTRYSTCLDPSRVRARICRFAI